VNVTAPKLPAGQVVAEALDVVEAGGYEVLVGDLTRRVKAALSQDIATQYPQLAVGV
jgi:hypothetical protein